MLCSEGAYILSRTSASEDRSGAGASTELLGAVTVGTAAPVVVVKGWAVGGKAGGSLARSETHQSAMGDVCVPHTAQAAHAGPLSPVPPASASRVPVGWGGFRSGAFGVCAEGTCG